MPQTFIVDQAATFSAVAFLESTPKPVFGSRTGEQATTRDGVPQWEVQVIGGFRDQFGKNAHEVIKINVASHRDPGEGLAAYTPVIMSNFVVGVTPTEQYEDKKTGQTKVRGGSIWYRADRIESAIPTRPQRGEG